MNGSKKLETRSGNPVSPEPFVFHAKALPTKRSKKGYGEENVVDTVNMYKLIPYNTVCIQAWKEK